MHRTNPTTTPGRDNTTRHEGPAHPLTTQSMPTPTRPDNTQKPPWQHRYHTTGTPLKILGSLRAHRDRAHSIISCPRRRFK